VERPGERRWSLEGARAVLPDVRERTERAVLETDALVRARASASGEAVQAIEARIQAVVLRWAREVEALGAEPKGVWLVDFDNGSGYYCWRWPEPALQYFHGYEEGFAGRTRIQ
jgi:hypothetical protein